MRERVARRCRPSPFGRLHSLGKGVVGCPRRRCVSTALAFLLIIASLGSMSRQHLAAGGPCDDGYEGMRNVRYYSYTIERQFPHDPKALTQGLVLADGWLYESVGGYNQSAIRKSRLETGEIVKQIYLGSGVFAEGLTLWQERLVQLTWREQRAFIYSVPEVRYLYDIAVTGETWGIAGTNQALAVSDGTASVRFLNPRTLVEERRVTVRDGEEPVAGLNELEFIDGELYGNVFRTDRIVRFSPCTGAVTGWIDLSGLAPGYGGASDRVLNGLAHDSARRRLVVTGKLWPAVFEVRLIALADGSGGKS